MKLHFRIVFPLCAVLALACSSGATTFQSREDSTRPDEALFVPKTAEGLKVGNRGNSIHFELAEPFPAERTLLGLDNHYRPPRWRKEDELKLFPGRRTSENPGGWSRYLEGDEMVHMWIANWVDSSGNSVTYVVRYRFPQGAVPSGGRAVVEGVYQRAK